MTGDYALLEDDVITNVIVADEDFVRDYVEHSDNPFTRWALIDGHDPKPWIGWKRLADGTFEAPPPPPEPEPSPQDIARDDAAQLLAKQHRTQAETTQLIGVLADLAGVAPAEDS